MWIWEFIEFVTEPVDWGYYIISYWPHMIHAGIILMFLMHLSEEYDIDVIESIRRFVLRIFGKNRKKGDKRT